MANSSEEQTGETDEKQYTAYGWSDIACTGHSSTSLGSSLPLRQQIPGSSL
jgi:hypothetical protein